jgi:hypothetical protein
VAGWGVAGRLLDLPVHLVLAAVRAKLLHLQALGGGLLVLGLGVVPVLALGTLKRNNIAGHAALLRQKSR